MDDDSDWGLTRSVSRFSRSFDGDGSIARQRRVKNGENCKTWPVIEWMQRRDQVFIFLTRFRVSLRQKLHGACNLCATASTFNGVLMMMLHVDIDNGLNN